MRMRSSKRPYYIAATAALITLFVVSGSLVHAEENLKTGNQFKEPQGRTVQSESGATGTVLLEKIGSAKSVGTYDNLSLPLSKGTYLPYTLGAKARVTATLIANPSRLNQVSFGYVYSPAVLKAERMEEVSAIRSALTNGAISFYHAEPSGMVSLERSVPKELIYASDSCWQEDPAQKPSEECVKKWEAFLAKLSHDNIKVIASTPDVLPGKPEQELINWHATVPLKSKKSRIKKPN